MIKKSYANYSVFFLSVQARVFYTLHFSSLMEDVRYKTLNNNNKFLYPCQTRLIIKRIN